MVVTSFFPILPVFITRKLKKATYLPYRTPQRPEVKFFAASGRGKWDCEVSLGPATLIDRVDEQIHAVLKTRDIFAEVPNKERDAIEL